MNVLKSLQNAKFIADIPVLAVIKLIRIPDDAQAIEAIRTKTSPYNRLESGIN
jgi:hypothetical protein